MDTTTGAFQTSRINLQWYDLGAYHQQLIQRQTRQDSKSMKIKANDHKHEKQVEETKEQYEYLPISTSVTAAANATTEIAAEIADSVSVKAIVGAVGAAEIAALYQTGVAGAAYAAVESTAASAVASPAMASAGAFVSGVSGALMAEVAAAGPTGALVAAWAQSAGAYTVAAASYAGAVAAGAAQSAAPLVTTAANYAGTVAAGAANYGTVAAGAVQSAGAVATTAIPAAAGIGLGVVAAHSAYTYWQNWQEDVKLEIKKNVNTEVKLFNEKLSKLKVLNREMALRMESLKAQEEKLNNATFKIERDQFCSRVVVAIGPTGHGKSLVCNRLVGEQRKVIALAKPQCKNVLFEVGESGDLQSQTQVPQKKTKGVLIDYGQDGVANQGFTVSVVDTPGAFDSNEENEDHFLNQMAEYFKGSGGVNMFCIFFKHGDKLNRNYKNLLKKYSLFWGPSFWKQCAVVITHCDYMSSDEDEIEALENALKLSSEQVRKEMKQVSEGLIQDVPIYEFGKKNFIESTKKLLLTLLDPNSPFAEKYECDQIKSPINATVKQIKQLLKEYNSIHKELCELKKKIENSKQKSGCKEN